MSTGTHEDVAVGVTEDGTVAFYDPAIQTGIRRLVPERRPLLCDDPSDLRDSNPIPTLSAFVRELLAAENTEEV